jgi:GNAT superfamily N-acetyltransferase
VPPLYVDEKALFTDKNIYKKTCESVFYIAQRNGKTVGRIQGIIQKQYNAINNAKQARFTRFDCENNVETAKALFAKVEEWAKTRQMENLVGPLGYSDLEREGLLIEGFDYLSTFEEQYNYEYYASLIESNGFVKDVDWVEFRLFKTPQQDERLRKFANRALERNNLHVAGEGMSLRAFIKKYGKGIFHCIDECYKDLYGVVPFTPEMMQQMVSQFLLLLNKKYILVICDENENVVAFGLCFPSIAGAVRGTKGRLTPLTLAKLILCAARPKAIDLGLVAVLPEYQNAGLNAVILNALVDMLSEGKVEKCETNLNLETNTAVISQWKYFDKRQHKRRRSYIKNIEKVGNTNA